MDFRVLLKEHKLSKASSNMKGAKKHCIYSVFLIVVTSDPQRLIWRLVKGLQVDLWGGGDHIYIYMYRYRLHMIMLKELIVHCPSCP